MRGRRCPELAEGELDAFFEEIAELELGQFVLKHTADVSEADRATLAGDFELGKQSLALQLKFADPIEDRSLWRSKLLTLSRIIAPAAQNC